MAKLTVLSVEKMRGSKTRREIRDDYLPGLYLIVQPSNAKSWAVRYRHEGRTRKHTLGPFPQIDLAAAREAGRKALIEADAGRDPAIERPAVAVTLRAAINQFAERHLEPKYRPKPLKEAKRLLEQFLLEENDWGNRKITEITSDELCALLEEIVTAGHPVYANRVYSIIRTFFHWCSKAPRRFVAISPCQDMEAPGGKEDHRDRILSDDELRAVWKAAGQCGGIFGPMVQLLILTGQRRGEVAGMERAEIDTEARVWSLPKERVKNNRRHDVPLSRQALKIIEELDHISDRYVFSLDGKKPINGFGKNRDRLHKLLPANMPEWVLHDLRRTVASGMARLGVSLAVIEKVLNHVSGSFAGIVGVYQHHEFADEKRAALEKWASHVERIVADHSAKVISLAR